MPGKDLLRKLDLHTLRCLCVLVELSHVSRAADQLGISQPAMSATLAQLREVFQDPLLVRTPKGMEPTANAIRFAASARAALELVEESFALTREFDPATAETTFRLSATESVGFMLVPRLTQALERLAPQVRVAISPSEPARLREQLEQGEADLVVAYQPNAPEALYTTSLYEQELRVVAAKAHPRIQGTLSVEQFLEERHVHYKPQHGHSTIERQVDEAFAAHGRTRRIGVTVPSALASAPIVAASNHIATLTRAVAEHAARSDDLQVLQPPFALGGVRVAMFWHERTHASSAHVWLRQVIRDLFHGR
jgi:DNA-binding transcriptional LysR family regulator